MSQMTKIPRGVVFLDGKAVGTEPCPRPEGGTVKVIGLPTEIVVTTQIFQENNGDPQIQRGDGHYFSEALHGPDFITKAIYKFNNLTEFNWKDHEQPVPLETALMLANA
jgi:hypothetical protein